MKGLILILATIFIITSCKEINTSDPKETYKYWSGSNPPTDLKILKGQYWQSSHWTKEYIIYMKFESTEYWWDKFIEQNQLQIDNNQCTNPVKAPNWFIPTEKFVKYRRGSDFDQGSRYFRDTLTSSCFIYEIQL
jgi:hypothetical protein